MINTNLNFVSKFKKANIASITIFLLSVIFITFKGLNFGIDFKGGTLIELRTDTNIKASSIRETLKLADQFYKSSFSSINKIPISFRFAILVARRVYREIGYNILKKKNIENYKRSGKIYVNNMSKVLQTLLSIYDFINLLLIISNEHSRDKEHLIINEEINLNDRF